MKIEVTLRWWRRFYASKLEFATLEEVIREYNRQRRYGNPLYAPYTEEYVRARAAEQADILLNGGGTSYGATERERLISACIRGWHLRRNHIR